MQFSINQVLRVKLYNCDHFTVVLKTLSMHPQVNTKYAPQSYVLDINVDIITTVKPLNSRHIGTSHFVHYRKVVHCSEAKMY